MSDALREAARRALSELGEKHPEARVERLTLDVAVDGRSELVTVSLRDGKLAWSSTGASDGPHVHAALRWLADGVGASPGVRISESQEMPRMSWPPEGELLESEAPIARTRLADALDDVVTTLVRTGASAPDSPSVSESLEQLRREAPLPTPTGIARWLGRLKGALDERDVRLSARLLEGAALLAEDLRRERPSPAARRRVVGWMGGAGGEIAPTERLSDRVLVEVAREQLASSERGGIERRHFVDLHNGEVFREERTRVSPQASVGPCPRLVNVGLAEVEDGVSPRRIRLMQYTVSPEVGHAELAKIGASAYRRFSALAERYRELVQAQPGLAEPFAIVAPRRFSAEGCHDDDGQPLPFARADDPAAVEVLARVVPTSGPRWIAGRLVDAGAMLMLVPCAVAIPEGEGTRLVRLR